MPRQMKNSGIEWMGDIPSDWKISKYKFFAQSRMGLTILQSETVDEGIPIYSATQDDKIFGYIKEPELIIHKGDFVIPARGNSIGCVSVVKEEIATCTQTTICSTNIHGIVPDFLYYCCVGLKSEWFKYEGAAIPQITVTQLNNNMVPLPHKEEQLIIAGYLNEKCKNIDEILRKTEETIAEYKKLKQAIASQAVTKGIQGERSMKDSGVEWLGGIPADWNVYRIANLYEERSESGLEELPILTVSINTGVSDHEIADEDKDRVFVRSEDRTKYKRVYPGDLAYNMMRAWQGAFGAVRVDGMVSPAYVVAKPKKNVELDSRYMEALLRTSEATEEMHRYSRGIVDFRLRLYWPEFKNIRICLPPIAEQIEIADYIDEKSAAIDALIAKKEAFAAELENYKKSMIYEYVTGKKEVPQS